MGRASGSCLAAALTRRAGPTRQLWWVCVSHLDATLCLAGRAPLSAGALVARQEPAWQTKAPIVAFNKSLPTQLAGAQPCCEASGVAACWSAVLQPVWTSALPFAPYMVATRIGFVEWLLLPDVGNHLQKRDGVCRPGSCQNTMQPQCCTGGSQSCRAQLASPSSCVAPASRTQGLTIYSNGRAALHCCWHTSAALTGL